MGMTKAKFLEAFRAKHEELSGVRFAVNETDEEAAVYAAETAGMVWDPEPVTLPERVMPDWPSMKLRREDGGPLTIEELNEAALRYNAWPLVTKAYEHLKELSPDSSYSPTMRKAFDCLLHALQRGAEVPSSQAAAQREQAILVLKVLPGGQTDIIENKVGGSGRFSLGTALAVLVNAVEKERHQ